jgi:glycosyltransferase involved in cell wall biosynthesis
VVEDGVNGVLVEPGRPEALADALARVLAERPLAEDLAGAARPSAERWLETPEGFARRLLVLVASLN